MKVLEQGNNHIEVPKKITCGKCASILEYLMEDISIKIEARCDQREGNYIVNVPVITCPVCKNYIKV